MRYHWLAMILALLLCASLVAAQPPTIVTPGIQGVPEYVKPGTPVTAFVQVTDSLKRPLSFYWTLTDPSGEVIQASNEATPSPKFLIAGASTQRPQAGAFVLEVTVTAPRPSDTPGLTSDAADVTSASFLFGLLNTPPSKPVILGINTAGDGTNGGRIVEVDGCGGALALFASAAEGRLLDAPLDPESAGPLWYTWEVFTTEGKIVLTSATSYNHIIMLHAGNGPADTTLPPGNYTARVTIYDSSPQMPLSVTAVSERFSVASCPNGYLPFSFSVAAILARVLQGIGLGELIDPFLGNIGLVGPTPGGVEDASGSSDDGTDTTGSSYAGGYGSYGGGYGSSTNDGVMVAQGGYGGAYGDAAGDASGDAAMLDPDFFTNIIGTLLQSAVPLFGPPYGFQLEDLTAAALSALQEPAMVPKSDAKSDNSTAGSALVSALGGSAAGGFAFGPTPALGSSIEAAQVSAAASALGGSAAEGSIYGPSALGRRLLGFSYGPTSFGSQLRI